MRFNQNITLKGAHMRLFSLNIKKINFFNWLKDKKRQLKVELTN